MRTKGGNLVYVKVARWDYELVQTAEELTIYDALSRFEDAPVPRLLAYVHEETPARVIGFALEALQGRYATSQDLEEVQIALRQLHSVGVAIGKVSLLKVIMTVNGPKFVDLAGATMRTECDAETFQRLVAKDLMSLFEGLDCSIRK